MLLLCVPVLPPVLKCQAGRTQPVFLFPTPSHSSVLYATVGQNFQLTAAAQAYRAKYVWLKMKNVAVARCCSMVVCPLLCPEGLATSK